MKLPSEFSFWTRLSQKRKQRDPALARRSTLGRYAMAVLATAIATQLRMLLAPMLEAELPFMTYFAAVVFITWYGGWGPSLVTLVLGWVLADFLFVGQRGVLLDHQASDWAGAGLYWFVGLTIAFLGRRLAAAKSRAEAHAETAEEREVRLRLALGSTGLGTWDFSPLTGKLELSEESRKMLGLDRDLPVSEQMILDRVHPEDRTELEQSLRDILTPQRIIESKRCEFRVIWPDRSVRQLVGHGKVFVDHSGKIVRCIGTVLDVTEERRSESKLVDQTEKLKRQTRELTHSNEELEQFGRLVAHDLRTPLVTLSLNAGLLAHLYQDKLDSEAHEIIEHILQTTDRMSKMITGLQSYSHVDFVPPVLDRCNCELALEQVLSDLSEPLKESNAQITHDPLPIVAADQDQFTELLRNIIENALKFRRDIPPKINISAEIDGGETRFAVQDNGIGIEPQNHERIFQIFQRLHKDESQDHSLGLGLAMCKKIVERYGGKIWVESIPGQGSTFYFSFPNPSNVCESAPSQEHVRSSLSVQ